MTDHKSQWTFIVGFWIGIKTESKTEKTIANLRDIEDNVFVLWIKWF